MVDRTMQCVDVESNVLKVNCEHKPYNDLLRLILRAVESWVKINHVESWLEINHVESWVEINH